MKRILWRAAAGPRLAILSVIAAIAAAATPATKIREPAVAGLFYPREPAALSRAVDSYLAAAKPPALPGKLKALIVPHAGYVYSGAVAAAGFRLLADTDTQTVVLLAPAHHAALSAASVSDADVFRTPLGDMPISARARELAQRRPFATNPRCFVQRPDWASQSSRPLPGRGEDRADTWEHADEVQVPFLQKSVPRTQLVPVVCGEVDPAAAAAALAPILDDQTTIVASSDLSHYLSDADARALDRRCIDAICRLDVRGISEQQACGRTPILTLMHVARARGWKAQLLDYRNSGETSGDKSRVVGYAAIAFYAPPAAAGSLDAGEQRILLRLAREAVRAAVSGSAAPRLADREISPRLAEPSGCFVTLTKRGDLCGCIGHILPQMPLHAAVAENARHAAVRDARFLPVSARELDELQIEVSVLNAPQRLAFRSPGELLRQLRPGVDGVFLQIGERGAVYLPQVWEQLPDKTEFLDQLAVKAGCAPGAWRQGAAGVSVFQVQSFHEPGGGS